MKISMLGHSGVGKTTYVASMYGLLQNPINGFSVRADGQDDHNRLIKISRALSRGRYPSPSDQRTDYDLSLQYKGTKTLPFRWRDYRGRALIDRKSDDQAGALIADLKQADGILVFCDCTALIRGQNLEDEIERMTYLVGHAVEGDDRPLALVIVLTKADLVEHLDSRLTELLGELIQTINVNPKMLGTVISVACGPQPSNVALPLLFVLRYGLMTQIQKYSELVEECQNRSQKYQDQILTFDNFNRWMSGWRTYGSMAQDAQNEAIANYNRLVPLQEPAQDLQRLLEELPLF